MLECRIRGSLRQTRARGLCAPAWMVSMTREQSTMLGEAWEENDYVFPTEMGGAQHHSVPEHRSKKLLGRVGLPPIRIHDLRHTAGSLMLAQGVPAPEVSRILGHASVDI